MLRIISKCLVNIPIYIITKTYKSLSIKELLFLLKEITEQENIEGQIEKERNAYKKEKIETDAKSSIISIILVYLEKIE